MKFRRGIKTIIVDEEKIEVKKSNIFGINLGYKVVHPFQNEDGSVNWFNILTGGGWMNWIIIGIIVTVLILCLINYANALNVANECLLNENMGVINMLNFTIG